MTGSTSLCFVLFLAACSSSSDSGGGEPPSGTGGANGTGGASTTGGAASAEGGTDTWATFARAFFSTYCVSCHDGRASIKGDFHNLSDVMQHQADIRCGIAATVLSGCEQSQYPPRQFPIGTGPKPSDAERARIVAWIDAGLPP